MIRISSEALLAFSVTSKYIDGDKKGLKKKDLRLFEEILTENVKRLVNEDLEFEYPDGNEIYVDQLWRNLYVFSEKRYRLISIKKKEAQKILDKEIKLLSTSIESQVILDSIEKFKKLPK